MTREIELLEAILAELKNNRTAVGFGHPPRPRYIYANRQYTDCLWYFWNGAKNEHEPIELTALTGKIERLEVEIKQFRGKDECKVNLHIKADRPYVIQSGLDTLFTKGLIYSLKEIESFDELVTIAVEPGDTEQVLFCRVYVGDQSIFAPWSESSESVDWPDIVARIQAKLGSPAMPPEPSPSVPELSVNALTGQVEIVPDHSMGIADKFTRQIKQMTLGDADRVLANLNQWRSELGESAYHLLMGKWEAKKAALESISIDREFVMSQISNQMQFLGWSKSQGVAHLKSNYQKATRSELDDGELLDFLKYLKQQSFAGTWN